ncbi:hypothetical protein Psuf_021530 [Phytohabitans suffuscus]|uniref:Uncharacterized protein n=1 Tax=Phytohabitans suffuscus TaxID=624315 RepID=A0A6F8YFJ6_9ACTN|nr:hypothetical protein Psuf_021530 [Phytohabitans suffuscus]
MRTRRFDSWSIGVGGGGYQYDWPLWTRAAERIDVPAGGVVPGPLDIAALPPPTLPSAAPLAEGRPGA